MHKRTGSILFHEIENVTEKTFDFCEALWRISISRYIGQCPVRCSPGLQTIKMLALSWHIVSGIQTPAPTIRAPKLQCRNNGWVKMILHINIYCPPPCHGAIHRKGLGQGRTHSSLLTQQNQAQNVFIIIHTPQTRHNDTAFCHDHRTHGGRNAEWPPLVIIYQ